MSNYYVQFPKDAWDIPAAYCKLYLWLLDSVIQKNEDDVECGAIMGGKRYTIAQLAEKIGEPNWRAVRCQKDNLEEAGLLVTEGLPQDNRGMVYFVRTKDNWDNWDENLKKHDVWRNDEEKLRAMPHRWLKKMDTALNKPLPECDSCKWQEGERLVWCEDCRLERDGEAPSYSDITREWDDGTS